MAKPTLVLKNGKYYTEYGTEYKGAEMPWDVEGGEAPAGWKQTEQGWIDTGQIDIIPYETYASQTGGWKTGTVGNTSDSVYTPTAYEEFDKLTGAVTVPQTDTSATADTGTVVSKEGLGLNTADITSNYTPTTVDVSQYGASVNMGAGGTEATTYTLPDVEYQNTVQPSMYNVTPQYQAATPTMEGSALTNPYTMGLITSGLGSLDFEKEEARRSAKLQESVMTGSEAIISQMSREVQNQANKLGKVSSSSVMQNFRKATEVYGATVAKEIATGELAIYTQMDDLRKALTSAGLTLTQIDSNERISQLQVDQNMQITKINDATARANAEVNANTNMQIAAIQANTALTDMQKEQNIAALQATAESKIAANKNTSDQIISEFNAKMEMEQAKLEAAVSQANTTNVVTGNIEMTKIGALADLTTAQIAAQTQLNGLNITETNDMVQFWANLEYMKGKDVLTDAQIRDLAGNQIAEQAREFDLSRATGQEQFTQNMELARDYFETDEEFKAWQQNIGSRTLQEQIDARIYDMQQFSETLAWSKTQFGLQDDQVRDLQADYLATEMAQFNISNTIQAEQWAKTFGEGIKEFNMTRADQLTATQRALDMQEEQAENADIRDLISQTSDLLVNPAFKEYFLKADEDKLSALCEGIFSGLAGGSSIEEIQGMVTDALGDLNTDYTEKDMYEAIGDQAGWDALSKTERDAYIQEMPDNTIKKVLTRYGVFFSSNKDAQTYWNTHSGENYA